MAQATGNEGCECMDSSSILSSLTGRACTLTTSEGEEQDGILLTVNTGSCVPFSYGANECLQHDMVHDKRCQMGLGNGTVPPYCVQSWCYVNKERCISSNESLYSSDYFNKDEALLFYSYSTCNSTADEWLAVGKDFADDLKVLDGVRIYSAVPSLQLPNLFKHTSTGEIESGRGDAYFNNSIPFEGLYIDYVKKLSQMSGGDIGNVTYSHTSKGSLLNNPASSYTAVVEDIEKGIIDMGVGPFWVTAERLTMTTFTLPLLYDRTVLVIPKPDTKSTLAEESAKVFGPFTWGMWVTILLIIVMSSLLSVWYSDQDGFVGKSFRVRRSIRRSIQRPSMNAQNTTYLKWSAFWRLAVDEFIKKGLFFFSAGIEQDSGASLPHKTLMFGFGFFILIAVSAYVANLAAFLTRSGNEFVSTMEQVVANKIPICAHPALEEELRLKYPTAIFHFDGTGNGWHGVLDMYAQGGICGVVAMGREDNTMVDPALMEKFCKNNLVFTDSLIIETPIAFPIRSDLASGLSYWIHLGAKYKDISMKKLTDDYLKTNGGPNCVTELSQTVQPESDAFAQIAPLNMILPILVFLVFALLSIILQVIHVRGRKKGRNSVFGRTSTLDLFANLGEITKQLSDRSRKAANDVKKCDKDSNCDLSSTKDSSEDHVLNVNTSDTYRDNGFDEKYVVHQAPLEDVERTAKKSVSFKQNTFENDNCSEDDCASITENGQVGNGECNTPVNSSPDNFIPTHSEGTCSNQRMKQLVESGAVDELIEFFQEMKRSKKDQ